MPALSQAVVLAAGRGKRMGTLTEELPKPMLPLSGKPMIEHILDRMRQSGVERVLLVTGYRAETIEEHLHTYPMEIQFQRQHVIDGTASATLLAREFCGRDPFLLTFGDIICEPSDYAGCSETLLETESIQAVLGVRFVDDPYQGAAVYEENGRVVRVIEKPPQGTSRTNWNSAGLYAFRPSLFEYLTRVRPSSRGEYELTTAIADSIASGADVRIHTLTGDWRDVGRPSDLAIAEEMLED